MSDRYDRSRELAQSHSMVEGGAVCDDGIALDAEWRTLKCAVAVATTWLPTNRTLLLSNRGPPEPQRLNALCIFPRRRRSPFPGAGSVTCSPDCDGNRRADS